MTPRKDLCSVYTVNGFMKHRTGQYRIIVLAESQEHAATILGLASVEGALVRVSRDTKDWVAFDDRSSIGDVFVVPFGTHTYEPVDADDVSLA